MFLLGLGCNLIILQWLTVNPGWRYGIEKLRSPMLICFEVKRLQNRARNFNQVRIICRPLLRPARKVPFSISACKIRYLCIELLWFLPE